MKNGREHAKQHDEAGRFRADGKKRRHRRRRALVNIRHPDLERHGRDLESERDQHQDHAEKRGAGLDVSGSPRRGGDPREIRLAGHAENPGDAVNQKAGRERAEDQIFHAGFERRADFGG